MSRARVFLPALAAMFATALAAHATVLQRMDVEELAKAAEVIAVARVEAVEARWEPDRSVIRTHVTLELERAVFGAPARRLHVSVLGGALEGSEVAYPAGATFRAGERVVVFLEKRKSRAAEWLVVGAFQGAFAIEREGETGLDVLVRDTVREGVALTGDAMDEAPVRLYLDELEARVRAARGLK